MSSIFCNEKCGIACKPLFEKDLQVKNFVKKAGKRAVYSVQKQRMAYSNDQKTPRSGNP